MIQKMLIANRGEIAVRLIRACAEMGIKTAAIYSEPDRNALHVKKADESYSVGSDPLKGYLDAHLISSLAVASGCDALHPGYGFLSENPILAQRCARRGIKFVGPSARVISVMGDKVAARREMKAAGVPVVPGSEDTLESAAAAAAMAADIGYPVMLKAAFGGGGRGIRRCEDEAALRSNYLRVASEAEKAFGKSEMFVEKCIVDPRHIEVQILADSHGSIVHLYERDCSIQRRNQKLIEIAPSPQLSDEERARVCGFAVSAARAVGYENAGTVEFLLDDERNFHFMEMNTRLQVEHTVTEQITGIDVVQNQILVADGGELPFRQEDIGYRGYAIEFRINAEDPKNNFAPNFNRITRYYAPGGPGVRVDGSIYTGYEIQPYYDSMCVKLTVWALDWKAAIERGSRALKDMGLSGIRTTVPYYLQILNTPEFREGTFDTGFVEARPELTQYKTERSHEELAVAFAAALVVHAGL